MISQLDYAAFSEKAYQNNVITVYCTVLFCNYLFSLCIVYALIKNAFSSFIFVCDTHIIMALKTCSGPK